MGTHTGGRTLVVALDESDNSDIALRWALRNIVAPGDTVVLVSCRPPHPSSLGPPMTVPELSAGAVVAWAQARTDAERRSQEVARHVLDSALAYSKSELEAMGVGGVQLECYSVSGAGGASGLAASVVQVAGIKGASLVVVGSRCMGVVRRSVMSLVGLGSVSDHLIHHLKCPVAVVRHRENEKPEDLDTQVGAEAPAGPGDSSDRLVLPRRKVCVSVDSSEHSTIALQFALDHMYRSGDELHVVSVAPPVPVPVVDEMAAPTLAAYGHSQWQKDKEASMEAAKICCEAAIQEAVSRGVPRDSIWYRPLVPEGGASEVAESILHYARGNAMSAVVLGSRGMGSMRSGMMAFLGLGSVSLYIAHHFDRPVIICKHPDTHAPPAPAAVESPLGTRPEEQIAPRND